MNWGGHNKVGGRMAESASVAPWKVTPVAA